MSKGRKGVIASQGDHWVSAMASGGQSSREQIEIGLGCLGVLGNHVRHIPLHSYSKLSGSGPAREKPVFSFAAGTVKSGVLSQ